MMNNIDLEEQYLNVNTEQKKNKEFNKRIKDINQLGQQIIFNNKLKIKSEQAYSENNEKDLFYDLDENYFSDCNLSEIANQNKIEE